MQKLLSLTVLSSLISLVGSVHGQVAPGKPTFIPEDCQDVSCVDLLNNNISLNIPIMSKNGSLPFSFGVSGNSYMFSTNAIWEAAMQQNLPMGSANGFLSNTSPLYTNVAHPGTVCNIGTGTTTKYTNWQVQAADGTLHPLPSTGYADAKSDGTSCLTGSGFTATSTDRSGYTASVTANAILASVSGRNGVLYSVTLVQDPNVNRISVNAGEYEDSMGLVALSYGSSVNFGPFSWTDVNGGNPQVSVGTSNLPLQSNFGCSGIGEEHGFTAPMPTSYSFPDGTSLGITYEQTPGYSGDYTGRISVITSRQGGTIAFTYGPTTHNGIDCTYQTVPVLTRTLGNGDKTTYTLAHSPIGVNAYNATNTVVDPGGNQTIYTFTGFTSSGISSTFAQVLTEVQRYQGNGTGATLLSTDIYCYNYTAFSNCSTTSAPTASVAAPISKQLVFHSLKGMSTYSATETWFDTYGNVIYSAQYDFNKSTPTRATTITYGSCTANCGSGSPTITGIGSDIYDRPGEVVTIQNGSTVAQTNYTYDSHGNLSSASLWNGSIWIGQSTANTYNSNGTPTATYDVQNIPTTYQYDSGKYTGCGTSCTQFPFPTSVAKGGLTISAAWYAVGGVKSADIDPNGNTTTYCYNTGGSCAGGTADPYWRVLQTIDPYGSTVVQTYPTGSSPDKSGTSFTFNAANSIESITNTTDGYGRPIKSQAAQRPSGIDYDTVSTAYSWSSNYFQTATSEPCSATAAAGCSTVHTFLVDPLGRLYTESTKNNETITNTYSQNDVLSALTPIPTNEFAKQTQMEFDGLGRTTSICQIFHAGGGPDTCAQNTGAYSGIFDSYSYGQGAGYTTVSLARGAQTRSQSFDALGRVSSVTTPEGGTTTYVYDYYAPSTCGGWQFEYGNLMLKTTPVGAICYVYNDGGLGRLTDVGVNGSANSYCKRFRYDSASNGAQTQPPGSTIANAAGRLVEAETDTCVYPLAKITDEWFSYDKDGRVTDIWEFTPHSGQYYHSIATFFENGQAKTLQLASPSLYTLTYTLDGEGRWNSLSDTTTGQNIVTGATFYPAANPAVISLTGTTPDHDSYTIDTNTGRINQFVFTVGNTPKNLTGVLSWNQNGTLGSVAITDGFNSGGTQTCSSNSSSALGYGYDDLNRLVEYDCGSGNWGQQYSYDQYDNLTKNVISGRSGSTWSPTYSQTTNHYGCGGCTTDAAGDVTNDGNNVYGWYPDNKLASTASSGTPVCGSSGECITYDGFGRMVENSSGGSYNELWYTQVGTPIQMAGAVIDYGYFPAPEGGTAIINGNSSSYGYMHKDWLGSARIVSSITGHSATVDQAYTPYGEIYDQFGSNNSPYNMFAGITQNFDPGVIWDATNRELSVVGRWLSPDPAGQGWNQYAYATNPFSFVDPTGLYLAGPGECSLPDGCTDLDPGSVGDDSSDCAVMDASCGTPFGPSGGMPWDYPGGVVGWTFDCVVLGYSIDGGCGGGGVQGSALGTNPVYNSRKGCISPSSIANLAKGGVPGPYLAYEASRASAWLTGGTLGFGVGGGAGIGIGTSTVAIGGSMGGSALFETDGLGNSAMVLSVSPPVQLAAMGANYSQDSFGAAANFGLQVTASRTLVSKTISFSPSLDVNGSIGPVGFDWTPTSVSLQGGFGIGARIGGSAGGAFSWSIPVCKE